MISFHRVGSHLEGGEDFNVYDGDEYAGYLCVTLDLHGRPRARFVFGDRDETAYYARISIDAAQQWVIQLLGLTPRTNPAHDDVAKEEPHSCDYACFTGLASDHVTRFGIMPRMEDIAARYG